MAMADDDGGDADDDGDDDGGNNKDDADDGTDDDDDDDDDAGKYGDDEDDDDDDGDDNDGDAGDDDGDDDDGDDDDGDAGDDDDEQAYLFLSSGPQLCLCLVAGRRSLHLKASSNRRQSPLAVVELYYGAVCDVERRLAAARPRRKFERLMRDHHRVAVRQTRDAVDVGVMLVRFGPARGRVDRALH